MREFLGGCFGRITALAESFAALLRWMRSNDLVVYVIGNLTK
jgi:hypothetical protein